MKRLLTLIATLMVMFCLASCDEDSNVTVKDKASGNSVGNVESNEAKNNKNVFIPDDSYVLYRETYTKTDVIKIYEYNEKNELAVIHRYNNVDEKFNTSKFSDYTYDSQGRIISKLETCIGNSDAVSTVTEYTYGYNSQGVLIKEIVKQNNAHIIYYYYDSQGQLISEKYESVENPEWNNTATYTNELCHLYKIQQ